MSSAEPVGPAEAVGTTEAAGSAAEAVVPKPANGAERANGAAVMPKLAAAEVPAPDTAGSNAAGPDAEPAGSDSGDDERVDASP